MMNNMKHKQFKIILNKNPENPRYGQYNGYLAIKDPNHKWFGKDMKELGNIDIHGGITFTEQIDKKLLNYYKLDPKFLNAWLIGFDTMHLGDEGGFWTKEKVLEEAKILLDKAIDLYEGNPNFWEDYIDKGIKEGEYDCPHCNSRYDDENIIDTSEEDVNMESKTWLELHLCDECNKEYYVSEGE